ncbi:ABC transporter permease [Desulfofalx alkaliphila]|uniref:ABC transporter permease n=1 Tax=Desulfofalx alkaliphila TaxID=105483 RepID=UPI0004E0BDFB|nr:ABC transporter permease [Desulfofalx alkaliphila]
MSKQLFHNTVTLVHFIVRRDRIPFPLWLFLVTLITVITASAFSGLYATEQERQAIAETMLNPAMIAMVGPVYGIDNYTIGAMMAHQMLLFTSIAVSIMNILFVTRHTREDEENGRLEMLRSLNLGRLSNLTATGLFVFGTNVLLALLIAFGLLLLGIESIDLEGSILYAVTLAAIGSFFASTTALFAQLSESSQGTIGFSLALLGMAYLIRAIGDVSVEALSWLSPLGWILRTEVYVNNYWWPVLLTTVIALIFFSTALYLNKSRDLGAGFLPAKPGRKNASAFLQSPLGLALKLQRTAIIAWAIGLFLLGISYGSVLGDLETFIGKNQMMRKLIAPVEGFSVTEQFLSLLMSTIAIICTIPVVMTLLKLRGEEKRNLTEHLLTRAVSRSRMMGSYFSISFTASFFLLLLAVLGLWLAGTAAMDNPIPFATMFSAAVVYLPAMWVSIGIAVFLIGLVPRIADLVWLYLAYSFFGTYLGSLLQLPHWVTNISPFGHIPQVPIEDINYTSMSVLTAIALAFSVIGFIGYNKRDLHG